MLLADIASQDSYETTGYDLLADCRKVKIHRDVMEAAATLIENTPSDRIAALSRYTVWPDYSTWIETERTECKRRLGFLFFGDAGNGETSVRYGYGLIFIEYEDGARVQIPVRYDMEAYKLEWDVPVPPARLREIAYSDRFTPQERQEARRVISELEDEMSQRLLHGPVLAAIKPALFTYLAFMNSPKLIRKREVDVRKINARRLKRGKYPFHPHHEVRLNIDKHDLKITEGLGDGPERGQHFVRAHLRFLVHPRYKNVSVALVPPHYRGNPELGMRNTSYAVDRTNSKWKEVL